MTQTLSPLDGRYQKQVAPLLEFFSEAALNRARLQVEVEWLILLCNGIGYRNSGQAAARPLMPGAPILSDDDVARLRGIVTAFDDAEAGKLAQIEAVTKHDVKAIEYYLAERVSELVPQVKPELIHFAFTSEDVNNLAYALNISSALKTIWLPAAHALVTQLAQIAQATAAIPMLSRTHGQAASPTTLGKELTVFVLRLQRQLSRIEGDTILGKSNGATGTFGAHLAGVPDADWLAISQAFVTGLGLEWNPVTTQIEPHDWQAELFADVTRFGRILHNLATDIWTYISLGYFAQIPPENSVGSSTMPHKINPIRFENAEANLEISGALFDSLSATLVTSRLQRDLTDSTTQRNVGVAFGHSLLAIDNIRNGLASIHPDAAKMAVDLADNWEVLAEPIQTAMRAAAIAGVPGMSNPYERLKDLSRGHKLTPNELRTFIVGLQLPPATTEQLLELTPQTYIGLATELVERYLPTEQPAASSQQTRLASDV